ncbi:MAG: hypothetical protein AAF705_12950, partial [Bacteroidota bacterium]
MLAFKTHPIKVVLRICIWIIFGLNLAACSLQSSDNMEAPKPTVPTEVNYLLEVALKVEFGGTNRETVKKWPDQMRVYLSDTVSAELQAEFTSIQNELNGLTNDFEMVRVEQPSMANFIIFVSDGATYTNYEPNAKALVPTNDGLVWIYWDGGFN